MSRRHFISDLHLGHAYVAKTRGFDSVDEHDRTIINAWKSTVSKRDSVWVLGDLCVGGLDRALDIIADLPGSKHLISGNHDACHPHNHRAHTAQRRYLRAFDSVSTGATLRIGSQYVLLSHFPYTGDHGGKPDRHTQWRLRDEGMPLLHGHVHDEWATRGRQFNVGVDHSPGMAPWREDEIRRWLAGLANGGRA